MLRSAAVGTYCCCTLGCRIACAAHYCRTEKCTCVQQYVGILRVVLHAGLNSGYYRSLPYIRRLCALLTDSRFDSPRQTILPVTSDIELPRQRLSGAEGQIFKRQRTAGGTATRAEFKLERLTLRQERALCRAQACWRRLRPDSAARVRMRQNYLRRKVAELEARIEKRSERVKRLQK